MNEATQTIAATEAQLFAALAAAQGEFPAIEKNREVVIRSDKGNYAFRYADLEQILAKTRPALSKNGIALFQVIGMRGDDATLRCELVHASGGRLVSELTIPGPTSVRDPKQFGAQVTYFRRYMVTSMLGVAADDDLDDDGHEATPPQASGSKPQVAQPQRREQQQPAGEAQRKTQQQAPAKQNAAPAAAGQATAGEIAYITKKITGAGLTIAQAREQAGLEPGDALDGLTKDAFVALKDALA